MNTRKQFIAIYCSYRLYSCRVAYAILFAVVLLWYFSVFMISEVLYLEDNFVVHVKFSVVEPIGETVIPPGALNEIALVLHHIGLF